MTCKHKALSIADELLDELLQGEDALTAFQSGELVLYLKKVVYLAIGHTYSGYRQILGKWIEHTEHSGATQSALEAFEASECGQKHPNSAKS